MSRWHLACDACDAAAWVGPGATGLDAWCESCQSAHGLPLGASADAACPDCGVQLSTGAPRFMELHGELQSIAGVLAAWTGDRDHRAENLPAAESGGAGALAAGLLGSLAREPFLRSPPAAPLAAAVLRAAQSVADHQPEPALREVRALMERGDVRRCRVPCARCGRGSIGVDGVEEGEAAE